MIVLVLVLLTTAVHGAEDSSESVASSKEVGPLNASSLNVTPKELIPQIPLIETPMKRISVNKKPIEPIPPILIPAKPQPFIKSPVRLLPLKVASSKSTRLLNTLREVEASEIIAKIQNGKPVEYDHVIIKGDLNLSRSRLQTNIIISPIRINDSIFDGFVNFYDMILDESIDLSGSNFTKGGNFDRAAFSRFTDFRGAIFRGILLRGILSNRVIFSEFTFGEETFSNEKSSFYGTTFSGNADFSGATFSGIAGFIGATFSGDAEFIGATFSGDADFIGATFSGNADFIGATFSGDADFIGATFSGDAYFSEATFRWDVYFSEATFSGDADFIGATFSGNADFSEATFSRYFFGWDDLKNALTCDDATYLVLIKNFKDHGQFYEADDCWYKYRFQYMETPSDYLACVTCGFGVKWLQTIYFGSFMVLLFGLLYFIMICTQSSFSETTAGYPCSKLRSITFKDIEILTGQLLDSIWFSTVVLLSVPSELYPNKTDTFKKYTKGIKYHLPILERLIGLGIWILFINTLSRTMLQS